MCCLSIHEFLSISPCSNVPGYEKLICFVCREPVERCANEFASYALTMALADEMKESFKEITDALEVSPMRWRAWNNTMTAVRFRARVCTAVESIEL